jgi:hypothetical protein
MPSAWSTQRLPKLMQALRLIGVTIMSARLAGNLFGPDQPHMQNALTALENAKDSLEKATTDKGGHRNKALDYVKDAIKEVKKGMEAAR